MAVIDSMIRARRMALAGPLTDSIVSGWAAGAKSALAIVGPLLATKSGEPEIQEPPPAIPPSDLPPALPSIEEDHGPEVEFPGLDYAIKQLAERELLSPEEFYSITASARQQAFTISGDIEAATIEKVRNILADNLAGPVDREGFIEEVRAKVAALPISNARLENVFRNASNESYAQGADFVYDNPLVADEVPFRLYSAIHDSRVRPEHEALEHTGIDGTAVYHKDDPVWYAIRPPNDYQCRCSFIAISIESAAALGVQCAKTALETGEPLVPVFVPWPEFEGKPITFSPSWQRTPAPV